MNGIINFNKPSGQTSYSIVAMVKRLTGEKKVGHAGTLDPMASGVLPVCLGQATRLVEYLMDARKTYLAEIELGISTDTYDKEGEVIKRCEVSHIGRKDVEDALNTFRGTISQVPPMYSAIKHQGKPLYDLARSGITVERNKRTVNIYSLYLKKWHSPILELEITCSKGTYIRSIANDLGDMLGCGARLINLERSEYGAFDINNAVTVDYFRESCKTNFWKSLVHPMDIVLSKWPAVILNDTNLKAILCGRCVKLDTAPQTATGDDTYCRAYTDDGNLVGILRFETENNEWQPKKVFS